MAEAGEIGANSEDNETASGLDLVDFLLENPVPCFANVTTLSSSSRELVYLYKEFTSKCFLAKSYSNMLESYLLHHRPSYAPSEAEISERNQKTVTNDTFISDFVTIPFDYPGRLGFYYFTKP